MRRNWLGVGILAWLMAASAVAAEQPAADAGLGEIHFQNSGAAAAQPAFLRGMLLLHSFEYEPARQAFEQAIAVDPGFALAYWGEAMTFNHALWGEQDLGAARAVLARYAATPQARATRATTAREREYLQAADILFGDGVKEARDRAYADAMGALSRRNPQDLEARAFYAVALLGEAEGKRDTALYMRSAAESEAVLQESPRHPGALHYVIHAYDDPVHAPLGLRAARLYGAVAPHAEHALHMPSHIYFALGLWDDAIAANAGSVHESHLAGEHGYHALLWLEYAYLQTRNYTAAARIVNDLAAEAARPGEQEARVRLAFARAEWLQDADGSAEVDAAVPTDSSGIAAIAYFAVQDFAVGLRQVERGDLAGARTTLQALKGRLTQAQVANHAVTTAWFQHSGDDDRVMATSLADALDGVIRFHSGERAAGIARVRQAIASSSALEFEYGPPWAGRPIEQVLGELLLADGQASEAVHVLEAALRTYPGRRQLLDALALARGRAVAAPAAALPHVARQEDLVGVWRLLGIETVQDGVLGEDAFYGAQPRGQLIYASNGYFSVQIASGAPVAARAAVRRLDASATPAERALAAAERDRYYAYDGRWTYDAATGAVTHAVADALYAGEEGEQYTQRVELDGNRMTFVRDTGPHAQQRKIWERQP